MAVPVRRPFGIGLLSILIVIGGVLDIIASAFLLADRNDDDLLSELDITSDDLTTYAWITIGVAVIVVIVGYALRMGANWARLVVGLIAVFRLVSLIWVVASFHEVHWYHALWPAAIYLLVAAYLFFDEDARAYFRRSA
jgi:hypothetical protein